MHPMQPLGGEPVLKWAGGKRHLLDQILPLFPCVRPGGVYFEPFLGAGAAFFRLQPDHAVLSDTNAELIQTFRAVRDDVDGVISCLKELPHSEVDFYRVRSSTPTTPSAAAARTIYLNKTCFNGLYRVNLKGQFNVPFGRHGPNLEICNEAQLRAASLSLQSRQLYINDFAIAVSTARPGDLVYFDPPYVTAHSSNGFIEYNAKVFSWSDQQRLAAAAKVLVNRGVNVVVTNADHEAVIDFYRPAGVFDIHRIRRWSTIAGKATNRYVTTELVLVGRAKR
jgi:DNA adenine methylase